MEPATPASTTLQRLQRHQLQAVERLVSEYKLGPNGLGPDQLTELSAGPKWRLEDFFHNYNIHRELGHSLFWEVISELSDTSIEGARRSIHPNETRVEHTAEALDDPTRNRSASTNSHSELNGLKHGRDDDNDEDEITHAPLPGTSTGSSSKRQKCSSKGRKHPDRFCPGTFNTTGQGQCECAKPCQKYEKKWGDAFEKRCLQTYRLKPKVNNMRYRCVYGCDRKFKDESELKDHLWNGIMDPDHRSCLPRTQNQTQTVNHNAVPDTTLHPQDPLDMSNGNHNGINDAASDDPNSEALPSGLFMNFMTDTPWNFDEHSMAT